MVQSGKVDQFGQGRKLEVIGTAHLAAIVFRTDAVSLDGLPDWSPDGSKIAFTRAFFPAVEDLYVMNPDGTGKTNLTSAFANGATQPRWSSDGSRILFRSAKELWLMNADGPNQVQLTNSPTIQEDEASWSPEGKRIAFRQFGDEEAGDIGLIKADGSKLWNLTSSPTIDDGDPVWRP
jgi:Tol biopolymer transport system component